MQNVSFDNSDEKDVVVQRPTHKEVSSKSEIAQWLAENKIIKTPKQGEALAVIAAILIIILAGVIFSYGMGKRQADDIETTGNVYLETE